MVQPWRQGGQGYVIADAVQIDNATNPVGAGNSPPLAQKSDEMPAPPNPIEMPDLPQMSAVGLPDGARRYGSTGKLFEAKNGQWIRWLPGAPEFTKPLKPRPEPLDAREIAIAAASSFSRWCSSGFGDEPVRLRQRNRPLSARQGGGDARRQGCDVPGAAGSARHQDRPA